MRQRPRLYYLKPIRAAASTPEPPPTPLTPETAPERLLWLDPSLGVSARGSVALNGSTQYLEAASNPSLQAGNVDWCWAGWGFINNKTSSHPFANKELLGGSQRAFRIFYSNTFDRIRMFVSAGTSNTNIVSLNAEELGSPPTGEWFFILSWNDSVNKRAGLVINGNAPTIAGYTGTPGSNTHPFGLGIAADNAKLAGRLDEVCWFRSPPGGIASVIGDLQAFLYNGGSGRHYNALSTAQKTAFGLVSWWPLNEASGPRADVHNGHNLTAIGEPARGDGRVEAPAADLNPVRSWTGQGGSVLVQDTMDLRPTWRSSGRLAFDGANDQLSRANPLVGNRSAFTLFARVRPDGLPGTNPAVIFSEADGPGNVVNRLSVTPSGQVLASYRPAGGSLVHATSASLLAVGTESVVAMRRNGTSLQVFVDGVPSGPAATIDAGTSLTDATLRVGGPVESTGLSHFNGRIASVFASGQALTNAQVASLSGNL